MPVSECVEYHAKYKTLSLTVMFESLKAFLIFSRAGIAIICLAKLESFQLLFSAEIAVIHWTINKTKLLFLTELLEMPEKRVGTKIRRWRYRRQAEVDGLS